MFVSTMDCVNSGRGGRARALERSGERACANASVCVCVCVYTVRIIGNWSAEAGNELARPHAFISNSFIFTRTIASAHLLPSHAARVRIGNI